MLFNSISFALVFLPITLAGYYLLSTKSQRLSIVFLLVASLVFYSQWNVANLPLILVSIFINYAIGQWISRNKESGNDQTGNQVLVLGLAFNLCLLGYFKYFDFLAANLAWLLGTTPSPSGIGLPLGISFFTFTQIAYLMDCHAAKVREYRPENYGLFVAYFPHLIAGPILHHREMMPQFEKSETHVFVPARLVVGMTFFALGLAKKVLLADGLARFVAPVFDMHHAHLTCLEAWAGALAYTFQLYFDFSAYSDMAYGLSYMFGIILPINFNSPYKARSIIDFWRRWHMTLSAFLRNYLYIPLGGNRRGVMRRYMNLLITMLLGGLWHGASWTFVVWGGLHGIFLALNHGIRHWVAGRNSRILGFVGWPTTFLIVVVGWVFFRAHSLSVAADVLHAMVFGTQLITESDAVLGLDRIMSMSECAAWLTVSACIAFFAPNAFEMIGWGIQQTKERRLSSYWGAATLGALIVVSLIIIMVGEAQGRPQFLYFNF